MNPNWQKEDILEVLSWCDGAESDLDTITTELEFIVVSELLKRCAEEIKCLRKKIEDLNNAKVRTRTPKSPHMRRVQKGVR